MKKRATEYAEIIAKLENLILTIKKFEQKHLPQIENVHPRYKKSAINLIHYWAMRQHDITDLQNKLKKLGLSRLGRAEAHIMASIQTTLSIVRSLSEQKVISIPRAIVSIAKGERYLKRNTKALLGKKSKGRDVRIMVTQPVEIAGDKHLVLEMVNAGMNVARINCAHDNPKIWNRIIDNVHKAGESCGIPIKICMDLGGPKVRTGQISAGPRVLKLRPPKDEFGKIAGAFEFFIVPEDRFDASHMLEVPVSRDFFNKISQGSTIKLIDTRGKKRKIEALQKVDDQRFLAGVKKSTYIEFGTSLTLMNDKLAYNGKVGLLPEREGTILLNKHDRLNLVKKSIVGWDGEHDIKGNLIRMPSISFTLPEIFDDLKVGEKVMFDDGKIEGVIRQKLDEHLEIEIIQAGLRGSKLRSDKGINFPDSDLNIGGLTAKDKEDLSFIAEQADIVNFSFVNTPDDVNELLDELQRLQSTEKVGIILKVETQKAYSNLFNILLTAMKTYPLGVMIARGDLAIECGWTNMARIQEEILSLCNAAHIPSIWATQVLENLAKTGLPSRSEITDAATAQRAECVMLNKGPNIIDAIKFLDIILRKMKGLQDKKASMLPAFK